MKKKTRKVRKPSERKPRQQKPHPKPKPKKDPAYSSLITLYNEGFDFATKRPDGLWLKCLNPKKATHRLQCTAEKEEDSMIDGFAEAVCAIPLDRKIKPSFLRIKRPLPRSPKNWPVYKKDSTLDAKRKTITQYARLTGCYRRYAWRICEFTSEQCDWYLKEFIRASRWLRVELGKKNPVGFWSRWKAEHGEPEKHNLKPVEPPLIKKRWFKIHLTRAFDKNPYECVSD